MNILGISAYSHDSAACLVADGAIVAAAQEERFTRKKFDAGFPAHAIDYCLSAGGIGSQDLDYVAFNEKPLTNALNRQLTQALSAQLGSARDWGSRLLGFEHHLCHAASAFFPSPFEDAVVLVMDGADGRIATSFAVGQGSDLKIIKEVFSPHSLGLLYSAFTYYTGFKVNSGEYKVMGLAPYGEPKYVDLIKQHLIDIKEDGSFSLNMDYFAYGAGRAMTNDKFHQLLSAPARAPGSALTLRDMDLAASIQAVTEEIVLKLARWAAKTTGQKNLCLAGEVALNCVANGKVLREGLFENIWIQPAAGDAGGALGAALAASHRMLGEERVVHAGDAMKGSYLGPAFSQNECEEQLRAAGAVIRVAANDEEMIAQTAGALADGKAVGWHQGRMEFGPRALGCRSILADPRLPHVQKQLNLKIKFRESFRPFAPSVLASDVSDWFEMSGPSPYMLLVADVVQDKRTQMTDEQRKLFGIDKLNVPRSQIPAVTHVDYSARVQTVHAETNPLYHKLLTQFKALTGCPVLVNTSFNVRGEPIVCTPEDAFHCLMGTEIDLLVVGRCLVWKTEQDASLVKASKKACPLDEVGF